MDGPDFKRLLAILLLVAAVGAGWYFRDTLLPKRDEPAVRLPKVTSDDAGTDKEPRFPVAPYEPRADTQVELVPLPSLDDSDSYFLLALVDVFGSAIEPLLVNEALIDRFVATVRATTLRKRFGRSGVSAAYFAPTRPVATDRCT